MIRVIIFIAAISIAACASTRQPKSVELQGEWQLQQLNGADVSALPNPITLRLDTIGLDSAQKRASGFAGCNQYFAGYLATSSVIIFRGIGSTKMFCEGTQQTENDFLGTLGKVVYFECDGKTLSLTTNLRTERLSFVRRD